MAKIKIDLDRRIGSVDRRIFGGFIEHLDRCIYGGVYEEGWPLSDELGYRRDVMEAIRSLRMPMFTSIPAARFWSAGRANGDPVSTTPFPPTRSPWYGHGWPGPRRRLATLHRTSSVAGFTADGDPVEVVARARRERRAPGYLVVKDHTLSKGWPLTVPLTLAV